MRFAWLLKEYVVVLGAFIVFSVVAGKAGAQTVYCPPNLDFELGNLSNWQFFVGNCCPISANTATAPLNNRHVLTSGTNTDPYGGFPIVSPGGGSYSLKLGNTNVNSQSEKARYYIHVPNTSGDYIFLYRYAVVFENPGHQPSQQPRFEVNAYDSATGAPVPCNQFTYISSASLPGFQLSNVGRNVYFKPWTTATINLTGYAGKTVALDFASGDCALGAHFGYGYVDMDCGLFQVRGVYCNGDTSLTLNAPPGFQYYQWMDSTFTQTIGTTQSVVISKNGAHPKYAIIVTPYSGFGCPDTFFTTYVEDTAQVTATAVSDTTICKNKFAILSATGSSTNPPVTFSWYPTTGLTCTTCNNPFASPPDTTIYHVIVTDAYGCKDTADVDVNVLPGAVAGADTAGCPGDSLQLSGKATGVSYQWYPTTDMTGANTLTPKVKLTVNRTYYLVMINSAGCRDTDAINVQVLPGVTANAGANQSACPGDSVTLNGSVSSGATYVWTPGTGLSSTTILNPRAITNSGSPYVLTASNSYGCKEEDSVYAYEFTDPDISAGNDTNVCPFTYVRLGVSSHASVASYLWSPAYKLPSRTIQNPYVWADTEVVYKVIVQSTDGCLDSDEIKVSVYPKPIADAGPDTGACMGQTVQLYGNGAGAGGFYFWYPQTGLSNPAIQNPVATVTTNKTYALVVSNTYSCKDTDDVALAVYPDPVADAGPDTSICMWQEIQLKGKGGTLYRWQPATGLDNPYTDTPKVFVTGPVAYQLKVYNQYGCSSTDSIYLSLNPDPVANAGPDTAVCTGTWMNLNGSGGGIYHWFPDSTVSNPYAPNPVVYAGTNSVYSLAVFNSLGCSDTDQVMVNIKPLPVADAGPDTIACPGTEVKLKGKGGGTYVWSPAAGLSDPSVANPVLSLNGRSVLVLKVISNDNCSDLDTVVVDTYPAPDAFAGNDTTVCPGATITLHGSGGKDYAWFPAYKLSSRTASEPSATIDFNIRYELVIVDSFGCKDTAYVAIDTIPVQFSVDQPESVCTGQEVTLNAHGGDKYTWWPQELLDNSHVADPVARPLVNTVFGVRIEELLCGRFDTMFVNTVIKRLPSLVAEAVDMDCARDYGELMASGASVYKWSPPDGLDDPASAHTKARPDKTTEYILTGTDSAGCTDTTSVILEVLQGDGRLYIPDAFTPNGDGINDCYRVHVPGDVTEFEFSIYNRWGERVFHATEREHCWDGNYKGIPAELSTYFYYYKARSSVCGYVFRKGDMHLIR
ncbi:MAG: gliding motility-associated C-terminal domain-containing protein [Chitinophagaceae bacterium]|nr:gliding motility-associated C-terminal domain-containing protein [Chitinophagaceae bacterium]